MQWQVDEHSGSQPFSCMGKKLSCLDAYGVTIVYLTYNITSIAAFIAVSLVAFGCGVIGYKRRNKVSATVTNSPNSSVQQGTLEIISNEQVVFERMQDTKSPVSTCGFQDSQLMSSIEPSVTEPIYNHIGSSVKSVYEMDDIMEKSGDDGLPQCMLVIAEESAVDSSHNSSPPTSAVPPTRTTADPFAKL